MNGLLEDRLGHRRVTTPFETAIQSTRSQTQSIESQIAQFETILIFYKHGVEIPHLIYDGASQARNAQHRAILTSILSLGEALLACCTEVNCRDLNRLKANVRYLREKYDDWFIEYDKEQAARDFETLING